MVEVECAGEGSRCFWVGRKVWRPCSNCYQEDEKVHAGVSLCGLCFYTQGAIARPAGWTPCWNEECRKKIRDMQEAKARREAVVVWSSHGVGQLGGPCSSAGQPQPQPPPPPPPPLGVPPQLGQAAYDEGPPPAPPPTAPQRADHAEIDRAEIESLKERVGILEAQVAAMCQRLLDLETLRSVDE